MAEVEIIIRVERLPDGKGCKGCVDVDIPASAEFLDVMMAAEFMLHLAAQKSEAGYEKALELLAKGAMTYRREGR